MIIYYSGSCGLCRRKPNAEPEDILKEQANVMLSYYLITTGGQDQDKRWPAIVKARRQAVKKVKATL